MWTTLLHYAFIFLVVIIAAQLVYPFITVALSLLVGKERKGPYAENNPPVEYSYGCVITAYRNAAIAKPLIQSLLRQNYNNHRIYLVADECPDVDFGIDDPRFVYLQPDPPLRLKAKSIIYAMERFREKHDFTVVFDADNLAHPYFLDEINAYANRGWHCIQGQRTAKNLDSSLAATDSLGELYKNYIERYVPYLLGGSAVISGSGMATETNLYWEYLKSPEIEQGKQLWKKMLQEDKILQNFLLRRNEKIAWAKEAICYDEKVETLEGVETQRSRWLFSYFQNFPNALGIFRRGLFGFSANQLYFGFVTLALPMFLQLGAAVLLMVAGLFLGMKWSLLLAISCAIFALTVLWTLQLSNAPDSVWRAVRATPAFVIRQFKGLFKMGNPNKNFKHSEHTKMITVEELLGKNK